MHIYWNQLKLLKISLSVTVSNDINFDYMKRYIRAIEKLTIADVVKYKNQMIKAMTRVVAQ